MRPLTPRQQEVLDLIKAKMLDTGMPPTRAEIARQLGFKSPNAAEEHVKALAKKGFIEIFGDHNDLDKIDEAFYGIYDSFQQFAEQYADETMLIDCPDHLTHYIDYKAIERDLSYDFASYDTNDYQTLIFNKNW